MIISKYNIVLQKIDASDLELLRNWRNSNFVKQFMIYKDYITSEMQIEWYEKINNKNNYYFKILKDGLPIGLTNIKDIDLDNETGESGIFLVSPEFINSDIGIRASIVLLDFAFFTLGLKELYQTIDINNKTALSFNKHLGVLIIEDTIGIYKGVLTRERYINKTEKIKKYLNNNTI